MLRSTWFASGVGAIMATNAAGLERSQTSMLPPYESLVADNESRFQRDNRLSVGTYVTVTHRDAKLVHGDGLVGSIGSVRRLRRVLVRRGLVPPDRGGFVDQVDQIVAGPGDADAATDRRRDLLTRRRDRRVHEGFANSSGNAQRLIVGTNAAEQDAELALPNPPDDVDRSGLTLHAAPQRTHDRRRGQDVVVLEGEPSK